MAEEQGANGAGGQLPAGQEGSPQVGILAQYIKDLSFENPNAPAVYQWQGQPQMDVQFNIGASAVGEDVHEGGLKKRKRGGWGKRGDLGGRRFIKKKKQIC